MNFFDVTPVDLSFFDDARGWVEAHDTCVPVILPGVFELCGLTPPPLYVDPGLPSFYAYAIRFSSTTDNCDPPFINSHDFMEFCGTPMPPPPEPTPPGPGGMPADLFGIESIIIVDMNLSVN